MIASSKSNWITRVFFVFPLSKKSLSDDLKRPINCQGKIINFVTTSDMRVTVILVLGSVKNFLRNHGSKKLMTIKSPINTNQIDVCRETFPCQCFFRIWMFTFF